MADGILRDKFKEAGIDAEVDSAGTANYHIGKAPDDRAVANMAENKHDISMLRARQFGVRDFDEFDEIYVMDRSNYENVMKLARSEADKKKVNLFMNLSNPGENIEVPDPYYGGDEGFQKVYEMLTEAADVLISKVKNG